MDNNAAIAEFAASINEHTGTPMARLRTPSSVVAMALDGRSKGTGVRAISRIFGKSHSTIRRWEERLANQVDRVVSPAPTVVRGNLGGG